MRILCLSGALAFLGSACAGGSPSAADTDPELEREFAEAQQLLSTGRVDAALRINDRILAADPEFRPAYTLGARGSLRLVEEVPDNAGSLIADAVRYLETAVELDAADAGAWLLLAEAHRLERDFPAGRDAALRAARLFRERNATERVGAAVLKAAENEMQLFVAARREELDDPGEVDANGVAVPSGDTVQRAEAVLSRLELAKRTHPVEAFEMAARVYQWLGDHGRALDELERGLHASPGSFTLHAHLQKLYIDLGRLRQCVGAYRRLTDELGGNPPVQWYLGRALMLRADQVRREGDRSRADTRYQEAVAAYGRYLEAHPGDDNTTELIAMCHLSRARMALDAGDLETAKRHCDAAYEADPRVAEDTGAGRPRIVDAFGANYEGILFRIGTTYAEQSGMEGLRKALEFFTTVNEKHPETFGTFYNNAGLAARDLGSMVVRAARDGTEEEKAAAHREAMELWERSYRDYEVAVELEPGDPRIVNDCGLMLIYHLHRDYDRARELFDRAIEVGTPMLEALDEDTPIEERRFVEEAVGDAYQNIAVMMAEHNRPFEEMKPYLEKAVELYPYERRAAARMLRRGRNGQPVRGNVGSPPAAPPAGAAPGNPQDPQDDRAGTFAKKIEPARSKAAAGDYNGALLVLDDMADEMKGYAPFHYHAGLYNLRYAQQSRDQGGGAGLVDGLYRDALRHLERAVELDGEPIAPRLALVEVHHDMGEFAAAAEEASSLLSHIRSVGGAEEEQLISAHQIRASAAGKVYIGTKQNGQDAPAALQEARASYRYLAQRDALDATAVKSWSVLEEWAGAGEQAVQVVTAALDSNPESQELLQQLVDVAARTGTNEAAIEALANATGATAIWYRGRARFNRSETLRQDEQHEAAIEVLQEAIADFEASMATNPAFTDSCEQWKVLCRGKIGLIHLQTGDLERAEELLLGAVRARPDRIESFLTGDTTLKLAVLQLADRHFRGGDLAETESIYRAATEAVPQDVDFANNHGLFARDLGTRLQRQGKDEAAREMFEASYRSYTRASELDPANVRLRNDRALILVYHLKRDWDLAKRLLTEAIADGERQLEEDPAPPGEPRQNQEEAVGDCYENLALYHLEHTGDLDAAEQAARRSMDFHPGRGRPGARRHLRRIERLREQKDGEDG